MPNDLIGDLSKARLFDLIKPLVEEKRSGIVMIKGRNRAELYIEAGNIVHGKIDSAVGDEAAFAIMDLDDGKVSFNWQSSPEKRTVNTVTEQLMSSWTQREGEWRKIKDIIFSSDNVFSIVVDSCGSDRTILEKQWGILALCNGLRSVSDVAGLLGRSVFEISKTICEMVEIGILKKVEVSEIPKAHLVETIDKSFFTTIEVELKKVMGPIARIIMDDTMAAFEESRESFPKNRVESFIATVCDQIAEEQKREQAGKAMYVAWLSSR